MNKVQEMALINANAAAENADILKSTSGLIPHDAGAVKQLLAIRLLADAQVALLAGIMSYMTILVFAEPGIADEEDQHE